MKTRTRPLNALKYMALIGLLTLGTAAGVTQAQAERLTLITSRPEGGPFPIDAAMADVIKRHLPGVELTVQSSSGGNEAIQLLKAGEADVAGVTVDLPAKYSYADQVRVLLPTLVAVSHLMAPKDSSARSLMDLKGKPVSMGEPGSGISVRGQIIRSALSVDDSYFDDKKLSIGQAADAFKDGNLELVLNSNSINNAAILDLVSSRRGVRFLSLPEDAIKKIADTRPDMSPYTIPVGTYEGQAEAVQTVAVPVLKVVQADFPEDLGYRIVKTIGDHWAEVKQAAPAAMPLEDLAKVSGPLKLHPGLERYLREKNVIQ